MVIDWIVAEDVSVIELERKAVPESINGYRDCSVRL
jgi:hypothetical protein